MNPLETLIHEPTHKAEYAVIWLHGLGADGHDFEPLVPQLNLKNVRFIFPHARVQPVSLNMGMPMRAWYDIYALDSSAKEDEAGIHSSQKLVEQLIYTQVETGIQAEKIFLAGFSQGGAMALHTALRFDHTLAGVIALSAYLPVRNHLGAHLNPAQKNTPIFMAHGQYDEVLPVSFGHGSQMLLQSLHLKVSWYEYPIGHSVCMEEIAEVKRFILQNSR